MPRNPDEEYRSGIPSQVTDGGEVQYSQLKYEHSGDIELYCCSIVNK
jgi:hypothetical protein